MALAEASRRQELARPTPFTSAGRHAIGARALAHPVRTLLVVYLVSRVVSLLALWVSATWFQNPAGVGHTEPGLQDMFGLWDGVWYERVAREGYPVQLPVHADTGAVTYGAGTCSSPPSPFPSASPAAWRPRSAAPPSSTSW